LKQSKAIKKFEVIDAKVGKDFYYLKVIAYLIDDSILFIREFLSIEEFIYSYHWQTKEGKLIVRWDNAPHHKHLQTYPHHKHIPEVVESYENDIEDVLRYIERKLFTNQQ